MISNLVWIALAISILALLISILARLKEISPNVSFVNTIINLIYLFRNWLKTYNKNIAERQINITIISSYNLRTILLLLPLVNKLPISRNNHFVKAYLYDFEKRISRNNFLVKSLIPIKHNSEEKK